MSVSARLHAQAFCWLCGHATGYMHTWSEIADHSCGRYKEEADKRIGQAQRNNKRYQHYCLRWWGALRLMHTPPPLAMSIRLLSDGKRSKPMHGVASG